MVAEKITLEELRTRVFSAYIGAPLIGNFGGGEQGYLRGIIGRYAYYRDTQPFHAGKTVECHDFQGTEAINLSLALKPIEKIADEPAIEICRMLVHNHIEYPAKDYTITRNHTMNAALPKGTIASIRVQLDNDHFREAVMIGCRSGTVWMPDTAYPKVGPEVYDYLRQNGYAINYGPWSVDQLVEGRIFTLIDPK